MIGKDLKRQILSIGMMLAAVLGLVMLLVWYYQDLKSYFALGFLIKYDYVAFFRYALTGGGFLIFTPILVVLPGVIQFCDDYNSGYSRFIITRVSKKTFLVKRYISTIISGGIACMLPLLLLLIGTLILCDAPEDYDTFANYVIYGKFADWWNGIAPMAHICLYGFIFGMVWASIGMMFASMIPNRYVALGLPVALFYGANVVLNALNLTKFSPVNMILLDIQDSQAFVLIYQLVLLVVSGVIYILVGNRRLKNA